MLSMTWRVWLLAIVLAVVIVVFTVFVVGAQAGIVPENGNLSNGRTGWAFGGAQGADCGVSGSVGHNASGSLALKPSCWAYSSNFSSSAGSVLTFWAYRSGSYTNQATIRIRSFTDQSEIVQTQTIADGVWTQYTMNVGSCSLCQIVISPVDGGGTYYFDDLSLVSAIQVPAESPQATNGNFLNNLWGWFGNFGSNQWNSAIGHTDLGAFKYWDNQATLYSRQISNDQSTWTFWGRCNPDACTNGWLKFGYLNYDSGYGWQQITDTGGILNSTTWISSTASLASVPAGNRISIYVQGLYSVGDDYCPGSGCTSGTPTPTPSPTFTLTPSATPLPTQTPIPTWVGGGNFPYGIGTPIPIDWTQYPTPAPYPTFPGLPANPTPMYGLNTPVPVLVNGGTALPIEGGNQTPVFITTNGTPLPIQGGNTTPVLVTFGTSTPTIDGQTYAQPFVQQANVQIPNQTSFKSADIQSNAPLVITTQGGGLGDVVDVHFEETVWRIPVCDLPRIPIGACTNVTLHYWFPDRFVFAGRDLLTPIYALGAAYLFVFFLRRLQKR